VRQTLIAALMLGCVAGACVAQGAAPSTLDFCGVEENTKTYSGHEVRITARFAVGRESVVLYDPKCHGGQALVGVEFKPKVAGQMKTLRQIVEKKHSALVTVEGTVHGGEPLNVDPKLPDWLKDRFRGSSKTYGHLGSFDKMIEISRVVSAKDVDAGVVPKAESPSPRSTSTKAAPIGTM
jgi:hypothetical protein